MKLVLTLLEPPSYSNILKPHDSLPNGNSPTTSKPHSWWKRCEVIAFNIACLYDQP